MNKYDLVKAAIECARENGQVWNPRFIKDTDFDRSKFEQQESDVPGFVTELVDQHGPGISGDDFYGTIAYQIKDEWLLLDYGS